MNVKQIIENPGFLILFFCVIFCGSFAFVFFSYSTEFDMCFLLGSLYVLCMVALVGLIGLGVFLSKNKVEK